MKFRTEVDIPKYPFRIGFDTPSIFIGSCFTENIGAIMRENKMPVLVNPFGVVYNPLSICNSLVSILDNKRYGEDDIQFSKGLWYNFDFHTRFSNPSKAECLNNMNSAIGNANSFLNDLQNLIVTFGTARVYRLMQTNRVVANCHKIPAKEFGHQIMTVDEIVGSWSILIERLIEKNVNLKIIFTVSPIRHWKDGPEGNQLSKATLIVAVHKLIAKYPNNAFYFPSYEIMMDDLRDYRFYDDDMLHPSPKAIEYIWSKFEGAFLDKASVDLLAKIHKIKQAVGHRPFNPNTSEHQKFLNQTVASINEIVKEHPFVCFDEELSILSSHIQS